MRRYFALCCFVVYSTRRFVLSIALCYLFLCFSVLLALRLPCLGRGRCVSWCFSCVCSVYACLVLPVSSSSWCLGGAAACSCGAPWTFLLPFFHMWRLLWHYLFLMSSSGSVAYILWTVVPRSQNCTGRLLKVKHLQ